MKEQYREKQTGVADFERTMYDFTIKRLQNLIEKYEKGELSEKEVELFSQVKDLLLNDAIKSLLRNKK